MGIGRKLVVERFKELNARMEEVLLWAHDVLKLAEKTEQPEAVRADVKKLGQHAIIMQNLTKQLADQWADAPAFRSH